MEIICMQDEAFYALIERVIAYVKGKREESSDKWISREEAMRRLNIKSKTTLQKLRDQGEVRFTQPQKKLILYNAESILEYLEKNSK